MKQSKEPHWRGHWVSGRLLPPEACKTQGGLATAEPRRVGSQVRAHGQELQEKREEILGPLSLASSHLLPGLPHG